MSVTDVFYDIHTSGSGLIRCKFVSGDLHNLTRGETTSFQFWLPNRGDDLVVSGSYTVESGTTELYDTITVESSGTLTVNGFLQGNSINTETGGTVNVDGGQLNILAGTGFTTIQNLADFAGGFAAQTLLDSTRKFREQIPSTADVDSILVGIEPSDMLKNKDVTGIWGLVDSGTDVRNPALNTNTFELEIFVVAEYSEYSDHTAVNNNLSV